MRGTWLVLAAALWIPRGAAAAERFDVVVVGAGIGGLTTALRAAERGLRVGVVDMGSVFGGHAVMSSGGLCIVDTPLQRRMGIADSPKLAYADFVRQGGDANTAMVKLYTERSRELIYDWLTGLGVQFNGVTAGGTGKTGNSVDRFHNNAKRGYGVVSPIYRECLRNGVQFFWNTRATGLRKRAGRMSGVAGENLRTGQPVELLGRAVVLATGGYENNMELVRGNWPKHFGAAPRRVVLGSGIHSMGSGLQLAVSAGGALERLDHQWIYPYGIPDPARPAGDRGLYVLVGNSIALNMQGKRFMDERAATREAMRAVMAQPEGRYWMLFDDRKGVNSMYVVGAGWQDAARVRREIVENGAIVHSGRTVEEAARKAGLPAEAVRASAARWNAAVAAGVDADFRRPLKGTTSVAGKFRVEPVVTGPFHLMEMYPLARKSMGGIAVDLRSRVLNGAGRPVAGLYAVGETTGEGGLNGSSALEGTFLGPSIVQGHLAAADLAASLGAPGKPLPRPAHLPAAPAAGAGGETRCETCHPMERLLGTARSGYWHFEAAHTAVRTQRLACGSCHAEMAPYRAGAHTTDRVKQIGVCVACHLVNE